MNPVAESAHPTAISATSSISVIMVSTWDSTCALCCSAISAQREQQPLQRQKCVTADCGMTGMQRQGSADILQLLSAGGTNQPLHGASLTDIDGTA